MKIEKFNQCRIPRVRVFFILIVLTSIFLSNIGVIKSSYGLSRYFNCVTRVANNNDTITKNNIESCYYKIFQGARDADADGNKLK